MYLPSKISSRSIGLIVLCAILLILPFKNFIEHLFSRLYFKLAISPVSATLKIDRLKKENLKLKFENQELEYLKEDNLALKQALQFKRGKRIELIGAEVISFDPSSWRRIVTVNVGKRSGASKGLFAVDQDGWLVGKIIEVKKDYSYLILISDPNFSVPAFIGKDLFGLVKGGLGGIKVMYIEENAKVEVKDKVWLKSPSIFFPIYIGEVKDARKDKNDLFWDIDLQLYSKRPLLRKIFIIK